MFILAWRNVWRKKGRSLVTSAAVAVVIVVTMVFFGFTGAADNGIYVSSTNAIGHLQVRAENYRALRNFSDMLLRDAQALETQLGQALQGRDFALVFGLDVPGLLESDGRSYGIVLQGLDQAPDVRQRFEAESLQAGRLPEQAYQENPEQEYIALGENLARNLNVSIGDTVYMYAPGTEGYGASAYEVSGILRVANSESVALTSLAHAQDLAAPEAISRVEIHLPALRFPSDDDALPELQATLQTQLGDGYSVETWRQISPSMAGFVGYFGQIAVFIATLFFILAGFLLTNTIYLSVMERVREFGVIRALGAAQYKITGMVFIESLLLCLLGMVIGLAIGSSLVSLMAQGIRYPEEISRFLVDQGMPAVFYGRISPSQLLLTLGFTLLTSIIAALLPARTTARLEPVEAMRFTG